MKFYLLTSLLLALATSYQATAQTANLTVKVSNLKNTKGTCRYCLFRSPDGFPNEDRAVKCVEVPVSGPASQYVFENLPVGVYAVGVVHDENENHKMDANFMGVPKEAYGTSNNVRGGISGPPKFEPASFTLAKGGTTLAIAVK